MKRKTAITNATEVCQNPRKPCKNTDIFVYINPALFGVKANPVPLVPVCRECWTELAEKAQWKVKT